MKYLPLYLLLLAVMWGMFLAGCVAHGLPPWCDGTESYCPSYQEMNAQYWGSGHALADAWNNSFAAPSTTCTSHCDRRGRCTATCF